MISAPHIVELRMYDYISIRLQQHDGNADDAEMEKKDAVLLITIQPTQEKQKEDDHVEADMQYLLHFLL